MKKQLQGWILIAPLLLGCLLFYAIPFGLVLIYSMFQGAGAAAKFVGLRHYQQVLSNEMFRLSFGNTMRFLGFVQLLVNRPL